MDVTDEHGTRIGEVVSVRADGQVHIRLDTGIEISANVGLGDERTVVSPSAEHHPMCRSECTGDTHYLTSEGP